MTSLELSNDELVREIGKTEKIVEDFVQSAIKFVNYDNKVNGTNFQYLRDQIIDLLQDGEEFGESYIEVDKYGYHNQDNTDFKWVSHVVRKGTIYRDPEN